MDNLSDQEFKVQALSLLQTLSDGIKQLPEDNEPDAFPRAEWDAMTADEQFAWARSMSRYSDEIHDIAGLFDCPQHGVCIPYAKEQIRQLLTFKARVIEVLRPFAAQADLIDLSPRNEDTDLLILYAPDFLKGNDYGVVFNPEDCITAAELRSASALLRELEVKE